MPRVRIPLTPPTEAEYESFQRYINHFPDGDKALVATADCPFYECSPGEWLGAGTTWGFIPSFSFCHHPQAHEKEERQLPCKGKRCNCPLTVHSWLQAWADGDIEEFVPGGDE